MNREPIPSPAKIPCLLLFSGNAIQAFGNGTDVNLSPKNPSPPVTVPPKTENNPNLPDDVNDSNTLYDTSIITTCTSIQVGLGLTPSPPEIWILAAESQARAYLARHVVQLRSLPLGGLESWASPTHSPIGGHFSDSAETKSVSLVFLQAGEPT